MKQGHTGKYLTQDEAFDPSAKFNNLSYRTSTELDDLYDEEQFEDAVEEMAVCGPSSKTTRTNILKSDNVIDFKSFKNQRQR